MSTIGLKKIRSDLQNLGINQGDTVMVHSSLKSIGHVNGGADTVINAFLDVLGPEGTLLMPSFQSGSEFFLLDRGCTFDINKSPSELGLISETFRKRVGVIRSLSPTHCTAGIGAKTEKVLSGHEKCKISCGWNTPYHKLVQAEGKIVLLGVTHSSNTTLHFVENTNGAPTICRKEYYPVVINEKGDKITVPTLPHMPGLPRNYTRVEPLLLQAGIQVNAMVGLAETRLINAGKMADLIGKKIRNQPLFLIEPFIFS